MWPRRQRRRHTAGQDKTDPDTLMEPLVEAMETVRISLKLGGEEKQEEQEGQEGQEATLEIAVGKNPGEEEFEANVTMGG